MNERKEFAYHVLVHELLLILKQSTKVNRKISREEILDALTKACGELS